MTPPQSPLPDARKRFMLREDIAFLNHGSFGAVARPVFDEQERWRRRLEAEPIELIGRRGPELVAAAKAPAGELLNMRPADFGLVTNATEGVNAVLHSLRFDEGDELLTTSHVYNAIRQSMRHAAGRWGAKYVEVDVPTPIRSADAITRLLTASLTDRTRLVIIDHVTSATGLIFPAADIVAACAARGVDVLIDGAHAPGMLALDVAGLGAAYYAGNLHKWCCAPKGCGFLWVRPDRQAGIHPCVVSHDYARGLATEFAWQGTRDLSAWYTIPAALKFMADIGWEHVRRHNHDLAAWAHAYLADRLRVEPLSPLDGRLLGSTATLPLPDPLDRLDEAGTRALQQALYDEDKVEAPLSPWQGRVHFRVSCQLYNAPADYERLATALERRARR
jgi:isopenicillin-N epimerase